jgi:arylsulfatase A-like enzyme
MARPNILIFMTDQEQATVLDKDHPCRTPNADRLAREGLRFTSAFTPTAHCCPSRATFMTGLYPSRHGIWNNVLNASAFQTTLNRGVVTFSEVLAGGGYNLAYSGKWHVSGEQEPRDFDWRQYYATCVPGDYHGLTWEQVLARARAPGPDRSRRRGQLTRPGFDPYQLYGTRDPNPETDPFVPGDLTAATTGIGALGELAAQPEPWCLFVGPSGPHDPWILPEPYASMYDPSDVALPPSFHDELTDKPRVYQRMRQFWSQLSEDEVREAVAHYWGYCTMQDDLLGMVLEALDASGQAEDTLVLFLADHGECAGAHGLFMKGFAAFEESYRIPCVMRWPTGISAPGRIVDRFITLADFAPTFAELAGTTMPETSGASLVPFLRHAPPDDWPDAVYSQFNGIELYYTQRFVRTKRWHYTYNGVDFDELYDLAADPHCLRNLAGDPAYAPVVEAMCGRLWRRACRERDRVLHTMNVAPPYGPLLGLRH